MLCMCFDLTHQCSLFLVSVLCLWMALQYDNAYCTTHYTKLLIRMNAYTHTYIHTIHSGFLLARKSDFTLQVINDVLTHPRCEDCRHEACTIFGFFDQGCFEKLFQHEYADKLHHFAVAQVQHNGQVHSNPDDKDGFLFCHLAGLAKHLRGGGCGPMTPSDDQHQGTKTY